MAALYSNLFVTATRPERILIRSPDLVHGTCGYGRQ